MKPRHSRDIGRIISLIKAFALLNVWFRKRDGGTIIANEDDVGGAFAIWRSISESQELNLPPYIWALYNEVILPLWKERSPLLLEPRGLARREIMKQHLTVYGRNLPDWLLRQQILPMLENAGLITQETDPDDKRKLLIYPTVPPTKSNGQNNSERDGRVNISESHGGVI